MTKHRLLKNETIKTLVQCQRKFSGFDADPFVSYTRITVVRIKLHLAKHVQWDEG